VTGSFAIPVPVDVIQSMSVHSAPDTAEYGWFFGGLTEIETVPPLDAWNFKLHDSFPGCEGRADTSQESPILPRGSCSAALWSTGNLNFTEETDL